MQITAIELIPIYSTREMGRTCPSDSEKAISHHIIVRVQTDADITGLGEMSDVNFDLTPETVNGLAARLEPLLVGRSPFDLTAIQVDLEGQEWEHQVLAGIDIALHDAIGKALDVHQSANCLVADTGNEYLSPIRSLRARLKRI